MDLKYRVDEILREPKSILGGTRWVSGARPGTQELKRTLLVNGEAVGAFLVSQAYPRTVGREFRHMITFLPSGGQRKDARCVCRLDSAPETDGPHINDFGGGADYLPVRVNDVHYHDWAGNRHLATARELPQKLLYARNINSKINNIIDGFWWFCEQNQIVATSLEAPEWPTSTQLL
jgi:hypothetical protein